MIFLRHPTPAVAAGTCYGRSDLDIADIGIQQIETALKITPPFKKLVASPAKRCRQLAERLAARHGLEPIFDERLWEMDMGDWEGLMWKDIDRSLSEAWLKDPFNIPTPNGENFRQVQERVLDAISTHDGETAIVCHAGPIRATQMAWQNQSFSQVFAQTPPYAEPIRILKPQS